MTPVAKTVLALGALCGSAILGTAFVHSRRADRHSYQLLYFARNGRPERVVEEYHHLPESHRSSRLVNAYYEEAKARVGDQSRLDLCPTLERGDCIALAVFLLGLLLLNIWAVPRPRHLYSKERSLAPIDAPTEGQIAFIRRFNNGIVPVGLTKTMAATMIKTHLSQLSAMATRQRIDITPAELLTGSKAHRERMKVERERKRAQEKLERQMAQERRQQERAEQKAQKAEDRLYEKRISEEERLLKARDDAHSGVIRKARSVKAQTIQEFQDLVNDILADKVIEPQEVRRLKAWLKANQQSADDFAQMFKLIDESLLDGVIDAEESQAIYEGIIDCLITLRERKTL